MSLSEDKEKILRYIEERRKLWSGGDEKKLDKILSVSFDRKDYASLCKNRDDFYWTLKHLEHHGLIKNINHNDPDDYVPEEYRKSDADKWPGEFVVYLPKDFDDKVRKYRSPQNATADEPIYGETPVYISDKDGIYMKAETKSPSYRIKNRNKELILFLGKEHLATGRQIMKQLGYTNYQRLSDSVADINKVFIKTHECHPDNVLIDNITGSGYSLNRQVYNFFFLAE